MNFGEIAETIQEIFSQWSIGHTVALLIGVLASLLVVLPVWAITRRSLKRLWRCRWETENDRVAELEGTLNDLNDEIETLRLECDRSATDCKAQKKSKVHWKGHYEAVARKHNDLVGKYNQLVKRFNELIRTAKDRLTQHRNQVLGLQEEKASLFAKQQELEQRLHLSLPDGNKILDHEAQASAAKAKGPELQPLDKERQEGAVRHDAVAEKHQALVQEAENLRQDNQSLRDQSTDPNKDLAATVACTPPACETNKGPEQNPPGEVNGKVEPESGWPIVAPAGPSVRPMHLGIDFGTHSTKVIVRIRGEKTARVLFLDEPTPGYPSFATPSLVSLQGGQLFFGRRASQTDGGILFRSLKISLLPPSSKRGWGSSDFPIGTTPDLLVAFYLAWVLGRVRDTLGQEQLPRPSLNVAAPMDHIEDEALKERYLHVVQAAWEATFGSEATPVEQGTELNRLRPLFETLLSRPIPGLESRRFEVLPETLAPIVSLFQNPRTEQGFYMMVDMGAGTTEFSVSHVNEPNADQRILCYSDASVLLGGDQFNENEQRNAANREACVSEEERLKAEFRREFRSVWYEGFSKEKDDGPTTRDRWKQLRVVMSGGGLRRMSLQATIANNSPLDLIFRLDKTTYEVGWHQPADIGFEGNRSGQGSGDPQDSPAYLAVAHGLSLERQRWPKFYPPEEVEVIAPPIKGNDPLVYRYHEW